MYSRHMRTTLTLDDDISARLIELQRTLGISFKEAVNLTLRLGLEQQAYNADTPRTFTVHARDMGQRPGLDYDNIGDPLVS